MSRKGQITPFLVVVIAVLLLAIAATRLIGEAGFERVRLANLVDGTLITAASAFARALNQIRYFSLGPGGMMINYTVLQAHTLTVSSPCACDCPPGRGTIAYGYPFKLGPLADGVYINALLKGKQLFDKAREIADQAPKDLKTRLYEGVFGGALIDEPKPFKIGEDVFLEEVPGTKGEKRVSRIDYNKYLKKKSNFQNTFRAFKQGDGSWYNNPVLSYSWNRTYPEVMNTPGVVRAGEPNLAYQAHLRAQALSPPNNISISAMIMPLIYFFHKPVSPPGAVNPLIPPEACPDTCQRWIPVPPAGAVYIGCQICTCVSHLGVLPFPWAWISQISVDNSSFGLDVRKKTSFRTMPFFKRDIEVKHTGHARVQGSVWSGYDVRMED